MVPDDALAQRALVAAAVNPVAVTWTGIEGRSSAQHVDRDQPLRGDRSFVAKIAVLPGLEVRRGLGERRGASEWLAESLNSAEQTPLIAS
jgi:hypothetical protein